MELEGNTGAKKVELLIWAAFYDIALEMILDEIQGENRIKGRLRRGGCFIMNICEWLARMSSLSRETPPGTRAGRVGQ